MRNGKPKIWLTRRGSSHYWVIRYEDPETGRVLQKSTGTTKKKEAERLLGQFRADLSTGRYQGPNNTSWQDFRAKYENEVLPGLARKTANKVDTVLDAVEEILKPTRLSELTASRLSKFIAELRNGERSESTIAGYVAHLKAALNWAVSVGLLSVLPKIRKPKRAKQYKKSKGRAPTEQEFKTILGAVPAVVGEERTLSWQHFLRGLWWSGLRLSESLDLWWDRDDKLRISSQGERLVLRIPAELEKGHQDRLLPVAPEFEEFLKETPEDQRTGRVFKPEAERVVHEALTMDRVSRVISWIGEKAGVVVHVEPRNGKVKFASAHDFRRAFGDRWALRVMPPVLMQLMRHESIETTMKYYVGRSVEATADVIWQAYQKSSAAQATDGKSGERDTLRDSKEETS